MEYTEIIYLITKVKGEDDIGNIISSSETSLTLIKLNL